MFMIDAYYSALTTLFGPVLGLHPAVGELIIVIFITFIITLFYKFLVDQKKVKELKDAVKEKQKQAKELQKTDPDASKKMTAEIFGLTNKQMKMTMKPMIVTLLFVILIFPWLKTVFIGPVVYLPFAIFGKESFGWLLWYIVASIPLSMLFRKAMGVL